MLPRQIHISASSLIYEIAGISSSL